MAALGGRFKASADGLAPGPRPASAAATRRPRTPSASPPRPRTCRYRSLLEPGDPPNPRGPFPGVFTAAQLPERFTSDGPRRIFFAADGTPAPQVRQKPEITAADGVVDVGDGLRRASSAPAPPRRTRPRSPASCSPATRRRPRPTCARRSTATALDLVPAGVDNRTGHGIIRADSVLEYTGATPQPLVRAQQPQLGRDHRRRRRLPGAGGDRRRSRSR